VTSARLPGDAAPAAAPLATWKAVALAGAALGLGVILVVTQLLVAQAKGIDANLSKVADNLEASNATIDLILSKSAVTPEMDTQVKGIGVELDRIDAMLARTNRTLARTGGSVDRLTALTGRETSAANGMESSLVAMSGEVAQLSRLLGQITPVSRATGTQIAAIKTGSAAAARGLGGITGKLSRYGLPVACEGPGRC
jgi:hypothetical protein